MVDNVDIFFVGHCQSADPVLTGQSAGERRAMRDMKWWSLNELLETDATVFPETLALVVRQVTSLDRAKHSS